MKRPAVFLDRDGTIIRDTEYVADPAHVELIPGAADAIASLNAAGIPVVVVTNQSGIARGMLTTSDYERVQRRLDELLAQHGARIDASYMCPHHPDFTGPCECRKPGTKLYRDAADALGLDLARSWYVGDRLRDVQPAEVLRGTGVLIASSSTPPAELGPARMTFRVVQSLDEAIRDAVRSGR